MARFITWATSSATLEATVERLVETLGAGPSFVVRHVPLEQVTSRRQPATLNHDSVFGQCGAMPIELNLTELHADSQGFRDFFTMVHSASVGWDGSDALRLLTDAEAST